MYFFKPTNKLFSTVQLKQKEWHKFVITGFHFIDLLIEAYNEGNVSLNQIKLITVWYLTVRIYKSMRIYQDL